MDLMAWTAELEHNTTGHHSTEPGAAEFGWICSCETVNMGGGVIPGDVSGHSPGLGTERDSGDRGTSGTEIGSTICAILNLCNLSLT